MMMLYEQLEVCSIRNMHTVAVVRYLANFSKPAYVKPGFMLFLPRRKQLGLAQKLHG